MLKPKLSIITPTFNGEAHISELIECVIKEMKASKNNEVEFILGINGSQDDTLRKIQEFNFEGLQVSIREFSDNLGYDRNILRLARMAKGHFLWFVGDDDYIFPAGLNRIIKILDSTPETDSLILEPNFFQTDEDRGSHHINSSVETFQDLYEYTKRIRWNGSALSSVVIKQPTLEVLKTCEKFIGTNWIHVAILYQSILTSENPKCLFLSSGTIAVRTSNPRWVHNYGNSLEVGLVHLQVLYDLLSGRSGKKSRMIFLKLRKGSNWNDVKRGIINTNFDQRIRILKLELKFMKRFPSFWFSTFPLLILPNKIIPKFIAFQEKIFLLATKMISTLNQSKSKNGSLWQ